MKRNILLITAAFFMLLAVAIPPYRFERTEDIFIPGTLSNYSDKLKAWNVNCTTDCEFSTILLVLCTLKNDEELRMFKSFIDSYPHELFIIEGGVGRFMLITDKVNKTNIPQLPRFCSLEGLYVNPEYNATRREIERVQLELEAFRELEAKLPPNETVFVENTTMALQQHLEYLKASVSSNATGVKVIVLYPWRKVSNAPLKVALWGGVTLVGLMGLILTWRDRT